MVPCVWPPGACVRFLPSRRSPDEMINALLRDLLPDLHKGISHLSDTLRCMMAALDATVLDVPEVLGWSQNWGLVGPVNTVNVFIIQEPLTHNKAEKSCTQRHPKLTALENGLIMVPTSSEGTSGKQACAALQGCARPDHHCAPLSCTRWWMIQATDCSFRHFYALSCLSSVNLLISLRTTQLSSNFGVLWQTPSKTPTHGHWVLTPTSGILFYTVWAET